VDLFSGQGNLSRHAVRSRLYQKLPANGFPEFRQGEIVIVQPGLESRIPAPCLTAGFHQRVNLFVQDRSSGGDRGLGGDAFFNHGVKNAVAVVSQLGKIHAHLRLRLFIPGELVREFLYGDAFSVYLGS
jgi:hypothetical protein